MKKRAIGGPTIHIDLDIQVLLHAYGAHNSLKAFMFFSTAKIKIAC